GVSEARLDRAADADVERQPENGGAVVLRHRRRLVGGAVVEHEHVEIRLVLTDLVHELPDRPLLVVGGGDGPHPPGPHTGSSASTPTSSSSRRARCAYVCSSRTRSRALRPSASACAGSDTRSR